MHPHALDQLVSAGGATPPCSVCGKTDEMLSWHEDGRPVYCPTCCPDHDYFYERGDRKHFCTNCGQEAPDDYYWRDW